MEKIHVCLLDYDLKGTFSKYVGVAMASIAHNTTTPVCFHILHDDTLTECNREKLIQTLSSIENIHGLVLENEIDFADVSAYFRDIGRELDDLCWVFSRGSIFYFVLPELLPDVDKIIKVDTDTVTTMDITKLWSIDIGDFCVAAVKERNNCSVPGVAQQNEYCYFNAGVSVLNLKEIRKESIAQGTLLHRAVEYFKQYTPKLPDQDFLNYTYCNKVLYLNDCFNVREWAAKETDFSDKIWHLGKILDGITGWNAEILYWKYLGKTAWKDELVDLFYAAAMNNAQVHRHSGDCIARLKNTALHEIKKGLKKIIPFDNVG